MGKYECNIGIERGTLKRWVMVDHPYISLRSYILFLN